MSAFRSCAVALDCDLFGIVRGSYYNEDREQWRCREVLASGRLDEWGDCAEAPACAAELLARDGACERLQSAFVAMDIPSTPCPSAKALDDMEDGDGLTCVWDTRGGPWYTQNHGNGVLEPPYARRMWATKLDPPRGDSEYALRVSASGMTSGSASLGFYMTDAHAPIDASAYAGFTFWARADRSLTLTVEVPSSATESVDHEGTCTADCYRHFQTSTLVGTEWEQIQVPFVSLIQPGANPLPAVAADTLMALTFTVATPNSELWIDDVSFY